MLEEKGCRGGGRRPGAIGDGIGGQSDFAEIGKPPSGAGWPFLLCDSSLRQRHNMANNASNKNKNKRHTHQGKCSHVQGKMIGPRQVFNGPKSTGGVGLGVGVRVGTGVGVGGTGEAVGLIVAVGVAVGLAVMVGV